MKTSSATENFVPPTCRRWWNTDASPAHSTIIARLVIKIRRHADPTMARLARAGSAIVRAYEGSIDAAGQRMTRVDRARIAIITIDRGFLTTVEGVATSDNMTGVGGLAGDRRVNAALI
jgi:hypothetical protein